MQIPRRVRIAFREELVGWYLRAIDDLFQAEGFRPGPDNPAVSGERRSRVEQYYSAVDWDSLDETSRVLRVFEEVLAGTANSEGRQNLIAVLQRDGFEVDDSGRIRRPGSETLAGLIERSDLPTGVRVQIDRMEKSLESDPEATIGAAKELIEATTKYVLDLLEVDYGSSPKVPELIRLTFHGSSADSCATIASTAVSLAAHALSRSIAAGYLLASPHTPYDVPPVTHVPLVSTTSS